MIVFLEFNGMQETTERGETNSNALVQKYRIYIVFRPNVVNNTQFWHASQNIKQHFSITLRHCVTKYKCYK